jgi:phospholipase C
MDRSSTPIRRAWIAAFAAIVLLLALVPRAEAAGEGIGKIQHVVMIMQENRSFDSYFGTYPGANGIPAGVCESDPLNGGCVKPFHDPNDINTGGPHGTEAATGDIDSGAMDGFVGEAEEGLKCSSTDPSCSPCKAQEEKAQRSCVDVMGYHDAREIPNYWAYAQNFVLQDNMFESAASWSLPEHLYLVSGWSALCPHEDTNPLDCVNTLSPAKPGASWTGPIVPGKATYAWTDLTYLLYKAKVSWRYFVFEGNEPDCEVDEAMTCTPVAQDYKTPGIWNPLADFTDVNQDGQRNNIRPLKAFYTAVQEPGHCGLPKVAWIDPNLSVSEHPPSSIAAGQAYVTTLVNSIMRSPCWNSTAIFLSWDDWGGFYDHVVPPAIDQNGYGLRVPGLVISPYAKAGYIDHQQLSHDAYLKFIEDDFLGGARLNPATDGRPDRRPDVREAAAGLGNLESDFNFNQAPRAPLLLPTHPEPGPASEPPGGVPNPPILAPGAASSIGVTSAKLNATVNPDEALVSDCHFEYGTSNLYGSSVPCTPPPGSGENAVAVSASLTALSASTSYYFRVVATNPGATSYGTEQTFTTAAAEALPEVGRCATVGGLPTTGRYSNRECTAVSKGEDSGGYEWSAGPATKPKFKIVGGAGTFGPVGKWQIACETETYEGEFTGARTQRATITLTGCKNASLKSSCQSAGGASGEITTNPLEGEFGFIEGGMSPTVGLDLQPSVLSSPILVKYECGSGTGSGVQVSEEGSVIGQVTPIDEKVSKGFTLKYTSGEGHQIPEKFEGGPKDTLTAVVRVGEAETLEEPSVWTITSSGNLEEPLEMKAVF